MPDSARLPMLKHKASTHVISAIVLVIIHHIFFTRTTPLQYTSQLLTEEVHIRADWLFVLLSKIQSIT
ncbi:hypothetical protein GCM10007895_16540 [Paraferrimonas sedimenticola]|uniref:Uncharacterized protein n=1 Tax=Paraferrimonas sedimenticola TaxID=375674 RepID=A0AA37RWG5_9GAMM|nr:hypothetical protein GCM10007895_16540 [Paraferrimonas sedimenticola]